MDALSKIRITNSTLASTHHQLNRNTILINICSYNVWIPRDWRDKQIATLYGDLWAWSDPVMAWRSNRQLDLVHVLYHHLWNRGGGRIDDLLFDEALQLYGSRVRYFYKKKHWRRERWDFLTFFAWKNLVFIQNLKHIADEETRRQPRRKKEGPDFTPDQVFYKEKYLTFLSQKYPNISRPVTQPDFYYQIPKFLPTSISSTNYVNWMVTKK